MANLVRLIIALAIIASAFILVSCIGYLLTDADFTYKMVTQSGLTFFLSAILSIIAIIMYFYEEEK